MKPIIANFLAQLTGLPSTGARFFPRGRCNGTGFSGELQKQLKTILSPCKTASVLSTRLAESDRMPDNMHETPWRHLLRLRRRIVQTGKPLDQIFIPKRKLPLLEKLMGQCGFSQHQIQTCLRTLSEKNSGREVALSDFFHTVRTLAGPENKSISGQTMNMAAVPYLESALRVVDISPRKIAAALTAATRKEGTVDARIFLKKLTRTIRGQNDLLAKSKIRCAIRVVGEAVRRSDRIPGAAEHGGRAGSRVERPTGKSGVWDERADVVEKPVVRMKSGDRPVFFKNGSEDAGIFPNQTASAARGSRRNEERMGLGFFSDRPVHDAGEKIALSSPEKGGRAPTVTGEAVRRSDRIPGAAEHGGRAGSRVERPTGKSGVWDERAGMVEKQVIQKGGSAGEIQKTIDAILSHAQVGGEGPGSRKAVVEYTKVRLSAPAMGNGKKTSDHTTGIRKKGATHVEPKADGADASNRVKPNLFQADKGSLKPEPGSHAGIRAVSELPVEEKAASSSDKIKVEIRSEIDRSGNDPARTDFGEKIVAMGKPGATTPIQTFQHAQPPRPVAPDYLMDQVARQLSRAFRSGDQVVHLRLTPPELGTVRIQMHFQDTRLKLGVITESKQTRELLLTNVHDLKDMLLEQGVKVERIDVEVRTDFGHTMAHANGSNDFKRQGRREANDNQPETIQTGILMSAEAPGENGARRLLDLTA